GTTTTTCLCCWQAVAGARSGPDDTFATRGVRRLPTYTSPCLTASELRLWHSATAPADCHRWKGSLHLASAPDHGSPTRWLSTQQTPGADQAARTASASSFHDLDPAVEDHFAVVRLDLDTLGVEHGVAQECLLNLLLDLVERSLGSDGDEVRNPLDAGQAAHG